MPPFLSLVLPCFNESAAIPRVIPEALSSLENLLSEGLISRFELIVVNDGSTDSSLEMLNAFETRLHIITHARNLGYGTSLKSGIKAASGDWIAFHDLDGTCPTAALEIFLLQVQSQPTLDLLTGVRLGQDSEMPWLRYVGNQFYRLLARMSLGQVPADCCSGFRMIPKRHKALLLERLPETFDFTLALNILAIRRRWLHAELAIKYADRLGTSKLNPYLEGWRFLKTLLKSSEEFAK